MSTPKAPKKKARKLLSLAAADGWFAISNVRGKPSPTRLAAFALHDEPSEHDLDECLAGVFTEHGTFHLASDDPYFLFYIHESEMNFLTKRFNAAVAEAVKEVQPSHP